jgi:predicted PurR-regulated permease PerM
LAVKKNGVENFLRLVVPVAREEYVIDLWKRTQVKIGKWLQGQIVLMVIVGVLSYLGLVILGVPNAGLLAMIAGLFEIIPVFGPILSAVPAIALAALSGGLTLALLTAGLFAIVQQFENNLIHPLVVTKVVGVSPIIVILAIFIGGQLAGFLGVLLAVPLAAGIVEFADDVREKKRATKTS